MTKVEHVLGIARTARTEREAVERLAEFLADDYIPPGALQYCPMLGLGTEDVTDIRPALPGMRCAQITGDDIQSGKIFCGAPAHLFGQSKAHPELTYVLCEGHARRHGFKLP